MKNVSRIKRTMSSLLEFRKPLIPILLSRRVSQTKQAKSLKNLMIMEGFQISLGKVTRKIRSLWDRKSGWKFSRRCPK